MSLDGISLAKRSGEQKLDEREEPGMSRLGHARFLYKRKEV